VEKSFSHLIGDKGKRDIIRHGKKSFHSVRLLRIKKEKVDLSFSIFLIYFLQQRIANLKYPFYGCTLKERVYPGTFIPAESRYFIKEPNHVRTYFTVHDSSHRTSSGDRP
jgi:hypothetical protein